MKFRNLHKFMIENVVKYPIPIMINNLGQGYLYKSHGATREMILSINHNSIYYYTYNMIDKQYTFAHVKQKKGIIWSIIKVYKNKKIHQMDTHFNHDYIPKLYFTMKRIEYGIGKVLTVEWSSNISRVYYEKKYTYTKTGRTVDINKCILINRTTLY